MILYKKYQMKSGMNSSKGLWYARPVINETLDIEALARHMSDHNTPYSPGVIKGVLTDMVSCIKELILGGKNVKLDDLAIFSCGILSDHGAHTPEEFKVSTHVKGVRLRARATGELSNKSLNLEATLREQGQYNVSTAEKPKTEPTTGGKEPGKETGKGEGHEEGMFS